MSTFARRLIGAAMLDPAIYEEVEADRGATGQALAVVLLFSIASGIASMSVSGIGGRGLIAGVAGSLIGWLAWATLISVVGTRLLPEPQTRSDVGELVRTVGFAAAPGLLVVFAAIPLVSRLVYVVVSAWMLGAMVLAVRQALDYRSLARAVGVCVVGWLVSLAIAAAIGLALTREIQ